MYPVPLLFLEMPWFRNQGYSLLVPIIIPTLLKVCRHILQVRHNIFFFLNSGLGTANYYPQCSAWLRTIPGYAFQMGWKIRCSTLLTFLTMDHCVIKKNLTNVTFISEYSIAVCTPLIAYPLFVFKTTLAYSDSRGRTISFHYKTE